MLSIDIPGLGILEIGHLVLDVNGTIARDGRLLDGVAAALETLTPVLHVAAVTADTRGSCTELAAALGIDVVVIERGREAEAKLDLVDELGADSVVAIGNGANDELMLRGAAVGIAVLGPEGCATSAMRAADVCTQTIVEALGLLVEPMRLIATMRR